MGQRLALRLPNLNDRRLHTIEKLETSAGLRVYSGGPSDTRLIIQYCDDLLELAGSI
jgi:TnpA family transposase